MRVGVHLPTWASNRSKFPEYRLKNYAKTAESHGFSTIWAGDHIVKPQTYRTSWLDPLTTLSSVSSITSTIQLGTSILILPLRNPVLVAKRALTLQHLSEERLSLGVGLGYIKDDFKAANVDYDNRGRIFSESLKLLYRLLNEREVTFDGEFYSVENLRLEPRTSRVPEILLGGTGIEQNGNRKVPQAIKQRLSFTDGWIAPTHITPEAAQSDWSEMEEYLKDKNDDPQKYNKVAATQMYIVPNSSSEIAKEKQRKVFHQHIGERRDLTFAEKHYTFGSVDEIKSEIQQFKHNGFDELNIMFSTHDLNEIDRQLELCANLIIPEI